MIIKHISKVNTGDKLGRTLYDSGLRRMLVKGTPLTDALIVRLAAMGYDRIHISEGGQDIDINPLVDDATVVKSVWAVKAVFSELKNHYTGQKRADKTFLVSEVVGAIVGDLFSAMQDDNKMMYYMVVLMGSDQYTYRHSVEVSLLSMLTAKALKYPDDMVKHIGVGAILHDIGKVMIPNEVLNKKETLTSEEMMQIRSHVTLGYDMVKEDKTVGAYAKNIILKHHERLDGKGYSQGLKDHEIDDYVNIVSIADVFHALISDRVYKPGMMPHQAVKIIQEESHGHVKPHLLNAFISHVALYPPGTRVTLNNGIQAVVMDVKKQMPHRPIVRYIDGGRPVEYDLSRHMDLSILNVIE